MFREKIRGPEMDMGVPDREHSRDILRRRAEELRRKATDLDVLANHVSNMGQEAEGAIWNLLMQAKL